jgi:hypothetical protein
VDPQEQTLNQRVSGSSPERGTACKYLSPNASRVTRHRLTVRPTPQVPQSQTEKRGGGNRGASQIPGPEAHKAQGEVPWRRSPGRPRSLPRALADGSQEPTPGSPERVRSTRRGVVGEHPPSPATPVASRPSRTPVAGSMRNTSTRRPAPTPSKWNRGMMRSPSNRKVNWGSW